MKYGQLEGILKPASKLVYGSNAIMYGDDSEAAAEVMDIAFENGFTVFDTANSYQNSEKNIGIDAEELDRTVNLKLAEKILSAGEKAQFDAAPDKHRALLTFWVLKEASVKLSGEGLRGYPDHTNFSLEDPRVTEMAGCLVAVLEEKGEEAYAF